MKTMKVDVIYNALNIFIKVYFDFELLHKCFFNDIVPHLLENRLRCNAEIIERMTELMFLASVANRYLNRLPVPSLLFEMMNRLEKFHISSQYSPVGFVESMLYFVEMETRYQASKKYHEQLSLIWKLNIPTDYQQMVSKYQEAKILEAKLLGHEIPTSLVEEFSALDMKAIKSRKVVEFEISYQKYYERVLSSSKLYHATSTSVQRSPFRTVASAKNHILLWASLLDGDNSKSNLLGLVSKAFEVSFNEGIQISQQLSNLQNSCLKLHQKAFLFKDQKNNQLFTILRSIEPSSLNILSNIHLKKSMEIACVMLEKVEQLTERYQSIVPRKNLDYDIYESPKLSEFIEEMMEGFIDHMVTYVLRYLKILCEPNSVRDRNPSQLNSKEPIPFMKYFMFFQDLKIQVLRILSVQHKYPKYLAIYRISVDVSIENAKSDFPNRSKIRCDPIDSEILDSLGSDVLAELNDCCRMLQQWKSCDKRLHLMQVELLDVIGYSNPMLRIQLWKLKFQFLQDNINIPLFVSLFRYTLPSFDQSTQASISAYMFLERDDVASACLHIVSGTKQDIDLTEFTESFSIVKSAVFQPFYAWMKQEITRLILPSLSAAIKLRKTAFNNYDVYTYLTQMKSRIITEIGDEAQSQLLSQTIKVEVIQLLFHATEALRLGNAALLDRWKECIECLTRKKNEGMEVVKEKNLLLQLQSFIGQPCMLQDTLSLICHSPWLLNANCYCLAGKIYLQKWMNNSKRSHAEILMDIPDGTNDEEKVDDFYRVSLLLFKIAHSNDRLAQITVASERLSVRFQVVEYEEEIRELLINSPDLKLSIHECNSIPAYSTVFHFL
jgi:hypothetical protein